MIKPASDPVWPLTVDEYLRREHDLRESGSKLGYEYVAGEVYLMSPGVSPRHSIITDNIKLHLRAATKAAKCQMFGDVITRVADDRYYYPDVIITCAPLSNDVIVTPCFVVEVTSPSTRSTDLREKPQAYRGCATIQGFLVVEQRRRHVFAHARRPDGSWDKVEFVGSGTIDVPCIAAQLTLDQIYETLDFPARVREDEFTAVEYGREWVLVRADSVS